VPDDKDGAPQDQRLPANVPRGCGQKQIGRRITVVDNVPSFGYAPNGASLRGRALDQ
jgi:hypothetical protein